MTIEQAASLVASVRREVQKALLGQDEVLDQTLAALLAGGHVLIEGLPGLGKTLLVRALAKAIGARSNRVQFTPDLMPSDIIGHVMYDVTTGKFTTRRGPVFTHLLIADEINRAPAKTQAALLEVMQEYQVSFDGQTHALERPFMTLATQNPQEHEGTYPLPDAQLDRFLLKVKVDYPEHHHEVSMVSSILNQGTGETLVLDPVETVTSPQDLAQVQQLCAGVRVDEALIDWAVRLVSATRNQAGIRAGASPRASLGLVRLARAAALVAGRDYVIPADIRRWAIPVLRHRVILSAEWELDGKTTEAALEEVLRSVEAPRQ